MENCIKYIGAVPVQKGSIKMQQLEIYNYQSLTTLAEGPVSTRTNKQYGNWGLLHRSLNCCVFCKPYCTGAVP